MSQETKDYQEVLRLAHKLFSGEATQDQEKELAEKMTAWFEKYRPTNQ